MGLDTSHNCWHGSYSSFSHWRQMIAEYAGYAVWKVHHDNGAELRTIMLDWGHVTHWNLMGKWKETPSDALLVLFCHSDCEGKIYPKQAIPLADRLEQIVKKMPLGNMPYSNAGLTRQFIKGLRQAAKERKAVHFH